MVERKFEIFDTFVYKSTDNYWTSSVFFVNHKMGLLQIMKYKIDFMLFKMKQIKRKSDSKLGNHIGSYESVQ